MQEAKHNQNILNIEHYCFSRYDVTPVFLLFNDFIPYKYDQRSACGCKSIPRN